MKRFILAAIAAASIVALALASGCAASAEKSDGGKVWGYVVASKNASLDVSPVQKGGEKIVVASVRAPQDAWIVVHADDNGKPGMRVGLEHIKRGDSTNVSVALKDLETDKVIVAIHADRGTPDKFDFDMMRKEMSADRPFFVDEKELAAVVTVR